MGWWESYDGTVIGDEFADFVGDYLEKMVGHLVNRYPTISKDQVLHNICFCSSYFSHFDKGKPPMSSDKVLVVMTRQQGKRWVSRHKAPPDMSKRVAPGSSLLNVKNPFTGDIV